MSNAEIGTTKEEKDLGVSFSSNLKVNRILGLMKRDIEYKEKSFIVPGYKCLVITHLQYCIQAWQPHCKKDIATLEIIQWGGVTK